MSDDVDLPKLPPLGEFDARDDRWQPAKVAAAMVGHDVRTLRRWDADTDGQLSHIHGVTIWYYMPAVLTYRTPGRRRQGQ